MNSAGIPDLSFIERIIDEREKLYSGQFKSLESLVNERDRQYDARFRASEVAVNAALVAQEKSVYVAFSASEKAVLKAEQAQKEYNERSNEFRGQLDDQAKTLMPRPETLNMLRAIEDKLATSQASAKSELQAMQVSFEKTITSLEDQVTSLRESRSAGTGRDAAASANNAQSNWQIGVVIGLLLAAVQVIMHFVPSGK